MHIPVAFGASRDGFSWCSHHGLFTGSVGIRRSAVYRGTDCQRIFLQLRHIYFTTNYISKGFTQTDDKPAVQVYAELSYGIFYVETFASNADFGSTDVEVDIGGGFRPTIGNLELNIGYAQYLYFNDSTDYGEAFVHASYPVLDQFSIGMKYWREVFADFDTLYLEAEVSDLPWGLSLSGGFGSDFGTRGRGVDADFGDIGLSKDLGENASIDIRGHYSRIEKNRLIGTLSFFF